MAEEQENGVLDKRPHRRRFLRRAFQGTVGVLGAGLGYSLLESCWLGVRRATIAVPRLPAAFVGTRIAFVSDLHHSSMNGREYLEKVVSITNSLAPDLILLGGDYVHNQRRFIAPCMQELGKLESRWGVFGVLGNHDHWTAPERVSNAMAGAGITELTNAGRWIEKDGQRLRVAGVDDWWEGEQLLNPALQNVGPDESALLLSHNPDYVETLADDRVGLVLSGHTHGGQVVLPIVGAPRVPSRYGQKYLHGLVKTKHTQVYVTRGVGSIGPMNLTVRFCCPPEISLLTIV